MDKDEPVNEVIRGEETLWKLPCREYHRKCRGGHPRINWMIEAAKDAWNEKHLWEYTESKRRSEFNYKDPKHVEAVISAALDTNSS